MELKPRAIIYDNDGMICHSERFSDRYCAEFGIDMSVMAPFFDGPFKQCLVGKADLKEELARVLGLWGWKGSVGELLEYWFSVGATQDEKLFPTVAKLKAQGLVVCLATNQEKYRTEFLKKKFGYEELFDEIFSSAELGAYKNSEKGLARTFEILRDKYGVVEKGEVLYWDDRPGNVEHIKQSGMNGQLFVDYEGFQKKMKEFGYSA